MTHPKSYSCYLVNFDSSLGVTSTAPLFYVHSTGGAFTLTFVVIGSSVSYPRWAPSAPSSMCVAHLSSLIMRKAHTFWQDPAGIQIQFSLLHVISLYKVLWDPLWKGNIDKPNIKHYLLSLSMSWVGGKVIGNSWENWELISSCIHPSVHSLVLSSV